jgi:hypothetical protein
MKYRHTTTGTFWGNVCGKAENVMPDPIYPEDRSGEWDLLHTNVVLVSSYKGSCGTHSAATLFITWTWKQR